MRGRSANQQAEAAEVPGPREDLGSLLPRVWVERGLGGRTSPAEWGQEAFRAQGQGLELWKPVGPPRLLAQKNLRCELC